jgi:hypothetical protein
MGYERDGHFASIDALREWCRQDGCALPARVWACKPEALTIRADDVLWHRLDAMDADAAEVVNDLDPDGRRMLQCLLDAWLASYAKDLTKWVQTRTAVTLDTK